MTKELKEITDTSNREGKHKEEYKGRMKSDLEDRMKIRKKLSGCINPLTETVDEFSDGIVNIATEKVTASNQTQFEADWRSAAQGLQSITAMWVSSAHI